MTETVFAEDLHPRDRRGRFREKVSLSPSGKYGKFSGLGGQEWGDEAFADWRDGLSPQEKQDLRDYTNQDYTAMNAHLRGQIDAPPEIVDKVERLTEALDRSEIPDDVTAHRILNDPDIERLFNEGNLVGAGITDDGFTSTTTDKDMLSELDLDRGSLPMEATVLIPKGTKGAMISSLTGFPEEQELLLKPGTTFEVKGAFLDFDGVLQMRLEAVEQYA